MDRGTVERHVNNPKGNRGNLTNEGKGRRKGVPNKFTGTLKEAILASFDRVGGVDYLEKQARENPQAYLSLLAKVLPMQISGPNEGPIFIVTGVMRTDEEEELYNQQHGLITYSGVNGSSGTVGHEPATIDHEPATDHEPAPIISTASEVITGAGLSRYRGSIWCHRPVRDPPWTRRRPKTFGNHSFSIIELHERRDRR